MNDEDIEIKHCFPISLWKSGKELFLLEVGIETTLGIVLQNNVDREARFSKIQIQ